MLDVTWLTLRQQRGALIGWSIGLFLLAALIMAFYPVIGEEYAQLFDALPEELRETFGRNGDFATVEGFLSVEYLSYVGILYAIFAVAQGTRALAGEEEDGTFDILLGQPITRVRVILEKALATIVAIAGLGLVSSVGLLAGALVASVDVRVASLLLVGLDLVPLSIVLYGFALLGSALFHQRGRATLIASAYVVLAYFINLFAPLAQDLDPLKWLSMFYYHGRSDALHGDLDPLYWAVSFAASAVLFGLAVLRFDRKDLHG